MEKIMKFLRKFISMLCLVSLSGILGPWALAKNAPQAQQEASTSKADADATFHGVKVADAKGKQTDAKLIFSDSSKKIVVRVADQDFVSIPYDQLDKASYEYTKKHRVTQGAIVMVASLGAGAIVMLTKSKSHWLYLDFHDQNAPKSVVLRMDKNEYKSICEAVKTHTGKEVEIPKDGGDRAKKEKEKKEQNTEEKKEENGKAQ
jgi:hypothetical protein